MGVSMAEWSKAPDSSSGLRKGAWVRTPLLTERNEKFFSSCNLQNHFGRLHLLLEHSVGEFTSPLALLRFFDEQSKSYWLSKFWPQPLKIIWISLKLHDKNMNDFHTDCFGVNVQIRLNDSIRIWLHDRPHPNKQTPTWIYIYRCLTCNMLTPQFRDLPSQKENPQVTKSVHLYSDQTLCTEVQSIRAVFTILYTSYEIFHTYISRRLLLLLEAEDHLCYSPCLSSAVFLSLGFLNSFLFTTELPLFTAWPP